MQLVLNVALIPAQRVSGMRILTGMVPYMVCRLGGGRTNLVCVCESNESLP